MDEPVAQFVIGMIVGTVVGIWWRTNHPEDRTPDVDWSEDDL